MLRVRTSFLFFTSKIFLHSHQSIIQSLINSHQSSHVISQNNHSHKLKRENNIYSGPVLLSNAPICQMPLFVRRPHMSDAPIRKMPL